MNHPDTEKRNPSEVKAMFGRVAKHYDLINRAMCGGLDVRWRKKLAKEVLTSEANGNEFLDVACGSGDVCAEILNQCPNAKVIGVDFCPEMLKIAQAKCKTTTFIEADCANLPFSENTFSGATISFGFRNFKDRARCLTEIARVLKPNAPLCILEVARANGLFEFLQKIFMTKIVPCVASLFGGTRADYEYLAKTTLEYPRESEIKEMFNNAGFDEIKTIKFVFGMVAITKGINKKFNTKAE